MIMSILVFTLLLLDSFFIIQCLLCQTKQLFGLCLEGHCTKLIFGNSPLDHPRATSVDPCRCVRLKLYEPPKPSKPKRGWLHTRGSGRPCCFACSLRVLVRAAKTATSSDVGISVSKKNMFCMGVSVTGDVAQKGRRGRTPWHSIHPRSDS